MLRKMKGHGKYNSSQASSESVYAEGKQRHGDSMPNKENNKSEKIQDKNELSD